MRLRRTSLDQPGWSRRRTGRGFALYDVDGSLLGDGARQRVAALAIPPAWTDVWISPYENGHLQAAGTDEAGRRQYLYHPEWRRAQDEEKFARSEELGRALGRSRAVVLRHLGGDDPSLERACAVAFRLLDLGCFRIGNDVYADEYGSFGLTTLQRAHLAVRQGILRFEFVGKSGVEHRIEIDDEQVGLALDAMRRRRDGQDNLLAYKEDGLWSPLGPELVNDYIRRVTRLDATAKDFRTWHATVVAASTLALQPQADSDRARKAVVRAAMEEAAELLGNTPAQARTSYVDPRVVERYHDGRTIRRSTAVRALASEGGRRPLELAVLKLLADDA